MSYIRKIAKMERRKLEPWEEKLDAELDAMKAADDDDERDRNRARLEREGEGEDDDDGENHGDTKFRGLGDDEDKEKTMKSVQSIIKEHGGVLHVAKGIVIARDSAGLTEGDITTAATAEAARLYPGMRSDSAFAKYCAENPAVLKACDVAKQNAFVSIMPKLRSNSDPEYRKRMDEHVKKAVPQVGGEAARDVNDPEDALAQIDALVEEARSRFPFKTKEQLFAQVYQDNPRLAAAERRQNRPGFQGYPPAGERERTRFPDSAYEPDMGRSDER
jgi:hypothetical protein